MTTIELPNCSVAVKNTGRVTIHRQYDGKNYEFASGGKITVVPFAVAHHFFGFELTPNGRLYRNTEDKYADTNDETAYYVARANFLPWGWSMDKDDNLKPYNPRAPKEKQVSKLEMFDLIRDAWENHIEGRLITLKTEINETDYAALPA
jgi:hypothetical protein